MLIQVIMCFAVVGAGLCYTRTIGTLQMYLASVDGHDLRWQGAGLVCDVLATAMMMIMAKGQISLHGIVGFIVLILMIILLVLMFKAKQKVYAPTKHPARRRALIFGWIAWVCWAVLFIYSLVEKIILPHIAG